jgi:hypothetical protein
MAWVSVLAPEEIDFLHHLPHAISFQMEQETFIVVHAGLVPKIKLEDQDPLVITTMRHLVSTTHQATH